VCGTTRPQHAYFHDLRPDFPRLEAREYHASVVLDQDDYHQLVQLTTEHVPVATLVTPNILMPDVTRGISRILFVELVLLWSTFNLGRGGKG
jgi:hypothetical protein